MVLGQKDSSENKTKIRPVYQNLEDFEGLKTEYHLFDTSLDQVSQLNPYRKQLLEFQDLGLPGTPSQALSLNTLKQPGFDPGFNFMNPWLYSNNAKASKLIVAPTPYTLLNYAQGAKELIFMEVMHTQNVSRRVNLGLEYRRFKSNNYLFYQLEGTTFNKVRIPSIYNLKVFGSYRSKLDKYYLTASVGYNKVSQRETGGLIDEQSFDTTSGNRRVFENPYTNAVNKITQPSLFVKQYYRFGKTSFQTEMKDSVQDTISFDFKPRGYFYHSLNMGRSLYQYTDPNADTPFYPLPIFTQGTNDSMVLKNISNQAGICVRLGKGVFRQLVVAGVDFDRFWWFNSNDGSNKYYNLSIKGKLETLLSSKAGNINLIVDARYFPGGYNAKDYLLSAKAILSVSDKVRIGGIFSSQRHVPDLFQSRAFTNHFVWNLSADPIFRNGIEAYIRYLPLKLKLGFNASNFNNYLLYFNEKSPESINFSNLNIYLEHQLRVNPFNWYNRIVSQRVSSVYHLPEWSINGGVFLEGKLFKKNMLARLGVDYRWYSEYYADAYNPYLRQFVWQDSVKIGAYPYFDAYVSAEVKTMILYIRFEHVNSGLSGNRFYSSPAYPNYPRFFRFGVKWRLFY